MGLRVAPPLAALLFFTALLLPTAAAAPGPAYLALGDSLAFGVGATNPSTHGYVGLTYEALRTAEPYRESGLELVNLSQPGATSHDLLQAGGQLEQALKEIERRAVDFVRGNEVEIISMDIGGNDLLVLAQSDSPCLAAPAGEACMQRLGEVLRGLQDNLRTALERLREAAPEAHIFLIDFYNPYSGTGTAIEAIADVGVQQLNGVIRAVASDPELRVGLASVFQLFQGRARQWIAADGIHPNDIGHAVIAEVLMAAIEGREPEIPEEILGRDPDAVSGTTGQGSGDGWRDNLLLLIIAVPLSFLAGAAVTAGYFLARGRT